uniref:Uncharacterized protein n=1 Tax=Ursus maritimus TaxID=29073 RepID=A0A452VEC5_URSMA
MEKPSEIDVRDKVWVKLIVSLSVKVINQGTRKDLTPTMWRDSFQDYTGHKITLEAVLNTTCKKCGCKGHFAKDYFMQQGDTKYSLIPYEEEEKEEAKSTEFEKSDPMRNSSKKKKEKKKKKHGDRKSSDPDSSDYEIDTGKRERYTSKDSKASEKEREREHKQGEWERKKQAHSRRA